MVTQGEAAPVEATEAVHDGGDSSPESTTKPGTKKKPTGIAYTIEKNGYWSRVGAQFNHEDGKGSTILLDVLPLKPTIVVRDEVETTKAAVEVTAAEEAASEDPKAKTKRLPEQIVYAVRDAGQRTYWTEIGIAYKHKDGKGLSLTLKAYPGNLQAVLRDRQVKVAKEPAKPD